MRRLLLAGVLAACALGVGGAHAQLYPSRPVTIIVPFPAGGSTDTVARIMAEGMQPILGQPTCRSWRALRDTARPLPAFSAAYCSPDSRVGALCHDSRSLGP